MFLVDKYKYQFEIDDKSCPYKVKKIGIIAPGVDTKTFNISDLSNKCSINNACRANVLCNFNDSFNFLFPIQFVLF